MAEKKFKYRTHSIGFTMVAPLLSKKLIDAFNDAFLNVETFVEYPGGKCHGIRTGRGYTINAGSGGMFAD